MKYMISGVVNGSKWEDFIPVVKDSGRCLTITAKKANMPFRWEINENDGWVDMEIPTPDGTLTMEIVKKHIGIYLKATPLDVCIVEQAACIAT